MILCCGRQIKNDHSSDHTQQKWTSMTDAQRKDRINQLWAKARRYNNKLRFQARLQKMAESNLKEMMIDDINEDADEENQIIDSQPKIKWYLIDTDKTFCKVWNFFITLITIYNLFVTPFIIVFPDVYMDCEPKDSWNCEAVKPHQVNLKNIELTIDIIYLIEIIFNFVKKTRAHKELPNIASSYVSGYFFFDLIATVPELVFFGEGIRFYKLKLFRLVHVMRLTEPLKLLLQCALQKYSKKRQNDLTTFAGLIFMVIYTSHMMACIWLLFGMESDCRIDQNDPDVSADGPNVDSNCTQSWVYAAGFYDRPYHTQYIFAFYWIFEVITTVGYGDYSGSTSGEYIFSIALEFMGLTFFSFLMGSINGIFNTSDNFDDLIEEKLDSLDMWIKKIEKSNKPFHIQPTLYNDIRKYVEQAFLYDFNLVIEEFQFYQQITPKMQTELIANTSQFKQFENQFEHFFGDCERGFSNEIIINMYCRIYKPGRSVISYKSNVKELCFIKQGIVEVFCKDEDYQQHEASDFHLKGSYKSSHKNQPILYLPKFCYFGDFQILLNLKSVLVYKTFELGPEHPQNLPDIIFMCVDYKKLNDLCDLFPHTAMNLKIKAIERRKRFMDQRRLVTSLYDKNDKASSEVDYQNQSFEDDESAPEDNNQNEDMKQYLGQLNKKMDNLVDTLNQAERLIQEHTSEAGITRQLERRRQLRESNLPYEEIQVSQIFKKQTDLKSQRDNEEPTDN
mmetsp:Transcript_393/g.765  ORF Transcript_393/g.765 Transcript_393/m.765 type:complete len:733 (-) Transcript_393:49-2247(-)